MHTKYKHPEVEVDSLDKFTSALNIESVDLYVQQEASQQEEDRPPRQERNALKTVVEETSTSFTQ